MRREPEGPDSPPWKRLSQCDGAWSLGKPAALLQQARPVPCLVIALPTLQLPLPGRLSNYRHISPTCVCLRKRKRVSLNSSDAGFSACTWRTVSPFENVFELTFVVFRAKMQHLHKKNEFGIYFSSPQLYTELAPTLGCVRMADRQQACGPRVAVTEPMCNSFFFGVLVLFSPTACYWCAPLAPVRSTCEDHRGVPDVHNMDYESAVSVII